MILKPLSKDKKHIESFLLGVILLILFALIVQWMGEMGFIGFKLFEAGEPGTGKDHAKKLTGLKIIYAVAVAGYALATQKPGFTKSASNTHPAFLWAALLLNTGIFFWGTSGFLIYDISIYPASILLEAYLCALCFSTFNKTDLENQDILGDTNKKKEDGHTFVYGITIQKTGANGNPNSKIASKEKIYVHNPFQGIWTDGGAGAGKSGSIVEPTIDQAIKLGFSGVVYDFKGNPPTLGKTVYNAINHYSSRGLKVSRFAMVNFSRLDLTLRLNPLNPVYLESMLHINEATETLLLNLNRSWIGKDGDFWRDSAILGVKGIIAFLKKHHPQYCTVPHLITFALQDFTVILDILRKDPEIRNIMSPIISASDRRADNQIEGIKASIQNALNKLYERNLFYVLNPNPDEDISLDVSNPANPTMLVLCNNNVIKDSISPVISLCMSIIAKQVNQQGKNPTLFSADELSTIYLKNLSALPATGRSNKVVTQLAIQDYSQLESMYKDKEAEEIISNMGSQFVGMTNNSKTAERISKMFGKIKTVDTSYSEGDSNTTTSTRLQHFEAVQLRDVMGQKKGHFMGKIADGEPPYFSGQFDLFMPPYKNNDIPPLNPRNDFERLVEENWEKIHDDIDNLIIHYSDDPE